MQEQAGVLSNSLYGRKIEGQRVEGVIGAVFQKRK
jgi:hypothetical protein